MARVRGPYDLKKRSSKIDTNISGANLTDEQRKAFAGKSDIDSRKPDMLGYNDGGGSSKSYQYKKNKPTPEKLEPNALFKYASYNTIFTLSAMTQGELESPEGLLNGAPHDIIIRSGGIGDARPTTGGLSSKNEDQLTGTLAKDTLKDAQANLARGRDLYFNSVKMDSFPSMNEKRKSTSVTKIDMSVTEPMGISLLDKIRGAAANCNYLDHINAPYLLTMEFKGFDELGNVISTKEQKTLKRMVPVKLIKMHITVNNGSTTYDIRAIPYNEQAFLNHFVYLRTSGQILAGENIQEAMNNVANILNKQVEDDKNDQLIEIPDTYNIVVDDLFKNEKPMQGNLGTMDIAVGKQDEKFSQDEFNSNGTILGPQRGQVTQTERQGQSPGPQRGKKPRKAGTVKQGDNVLTIITELMKSLPRFQEEGSIDKFMAAIKDSNEEMYFDYFMIESSVVPDAEQFDRLRGVHPRKVTFNVVPYQVHAYSLAEPGTSTGTNFEPFVKKAYNYTFTGDNVDIIDLSINYKVAYFSSKLKDIEGKASGDKLSATSDKPETMKRADKETVDTMKDAQYGPHQSEVGVAKSVTSGINKGPATALDQRLDALSNPKGDMVLVDMTILGDPAYLGQTQFIPTTADKDTLAKNQRKLSFSSGNRRIWNEIFGNYNMGFGDTVIKLNFRTPTDLNELTGTYEINAQEQIAFSGLYKVIKVISSFEDGKFTQVLEMARFKNQGDKPEVYTEKSYIKKSIHDNHPMMADRLVELGEYNAKRADIRESYGSVGQYVNAKVKELADAAQDKIKEKLGIRRRK